VGTFVDPLEPPPSYASLPTPTPGGSNITDQTPQADGIAALGGRASATTQVAARDAGLVTHASRYGTQSNIRQTLATEDKELRTKRGVRDLITIGPVDRYTKTYQRQWLDEYREAERLRSRGVVVPSAPPTPPLRK